MEHACENDEVTGFSYLALICAALFAVGNWLAVVRATKLLEYICKPATTVALLALALTLDVPNSGAKAWLGIALLFCLAGDVFLMLPSDAFVPGLASFAVGQICFAVNFGLQEPSDGRVVLAVAVVFPGAWLLARRFLNALKHRGVGELALPVAVYISVISVMVVASISAGTAVGVSGALLFMISDSLIAEHRFVTPRKWQPVSIMITYHFALAGITLGLL